MDQEIHWYYLWYSKKEAQIIRESSGVRRFFRTDRGTIVEATKGEMNKNDFVAHYDDYEFRGYGTWDHFEHYS